MGDIRARSRRAIRSRSTVSTICDTSPQGFRAEPGEVLVSTFTYDAGADAVTVSIRREDGSGESTFVATHPNMDPTLSWAPLVGHMRLIMAIESVGVTGPSNWPALPASWPVTMTYGGDDPAAFVPVPVNQTGPTLACDEARIAGHIKA